MYLCNTRNLRLVYRVPTGLKPTDRVPTGHELTDRVPADHKHIDRVLAGYKLIYDQAAVCRIQKSACRLFNTSRICDLGKIDLKS